MKHLYLIVSFLISFHFSVVAQEIPVTEIGALSQVYGNTVKSEDSQSFNDLGIEFGYALYATEIEVKTDKPILDLENVRDYASVYLNNDLQGIVTDNNKCLVLDAPAGKYTLRLYVENIGRITYGPEILDNLKGIFGKITLDNESIQNWSMVPLNVRQCDVRNLHFDERKPNQLPSFYKGYFNLATVKDYYLNISGWGMGEVWVNGSYIGSYWDEEKQQSINMPAENLINGKNEIVIFELKNDSQKVLKLSDTPVFK